MNKELKGNLKLAGYLLVVGFVMTYFVCTSCRDISSKYLIVSLYNSSLWIFLWIGNASLSHILDKKISWVNFPVRRFWVGMVAMTIYTLLALLGIFEFFRIVFLFDLREDMRFVIISAVSITLVISLFMHGKTFLVNWKQAALDSERLKKENFKAQLDSLRSQVNPHFLFNSLNALSNLVYEDQEKAVKFIRQLSEVYRYVLDTRDREIIPLEEELKFMSSYIYLQQIRFGDKIEFKVSINGANTMVAPLALQMLVENAIKHNVISDQQHLSIELLANEHYLIIRNNLQTKKVLQEESPGYGLENIKRRYDFLSTQKVQIENDGKHFIVKLPLIPIIP